MMKIKKKTFILLISYLSVAVLFLGGYAFAMNDIGGNYGNTARDGYQHAFDEVSTAIQDLDSTLKKGVYATGSPMTETICSKIYGDCLAAQMTLSSLPFSTQEMEQTSGFVGRLGDYAYTLCRTAPANGGFSDEERTSLSKLSATASQIAAQISKLRADVTAGNVTMDDPENTVRLRTDDYRNSTTLSSALLKNEGAFPEQDELEYDGKYTYKETKSGGDIVTQGEALKAAAAFLNMDQSKIKAKYVSEAEKLCYYFSVNVPDGEASITVDGGSGKVRSFTSSRVVTKGEVTQDKAAADAKKLIEQNGYGSVTLTKVDITDGAVRCEFAPVLGGAKCYPDLIKISIATDTGGVCAFDASDYIDNHKDRTVPSDLISAEKAQEALPKTLSVKSDALAIIQSAGGKDVFCREFKCTDKNGNPVTVYVDAKTGQQQEILLS